MDSMSVSEETADKSNHPSPTDFEAFLPWACAQLQVDAKVVVIKSEQGVYTSPFTTDKKGRKTPKFKDDKASTEVELDSKAVSPEVLDMGIEDNIVNIEAVHDHNGHLVQLKFLRNDRIPPLLLKIISLVVQFYPHLNTVVIDKGLRYAGLYQLINIVSLSKISEVILDNVPLQYINYNTLFDKNKTLKYLSLARCSINDTAVEVIATKLLNSSLSILKLSSNRITDVGATHLGKALRYNRKLTYLNLAGNMITDIGAASILDCLIEFPLNPEEIIEKKSRHLAYLRNKKDLVETLVNELRTAETEKKLSKRKSLKVPPVIAKKGKTLEREISLRSLKSTTESKIGTLDIAYSALLNRAEAKAVYSLGPFEDPFNSVNTTNKDGVLYCRGNNSLCYLNLAYNNLTYFSVKKLFDVLCTQESSGRSPRGLVNVCIEGNNIPEKCTELSEIDYILQSALATNQRTSTMFKKRPTKIALR